MERPLEQFQSLNYLLDKFHIRTIIFGSIVKNLIAPAQLPGTPLIGCFNDYLQDPYFCVIVFPGLCQLTR